MDDLTNKITETRAGVTDIKQFIDGMRTSRDTKMAELNALKNQLKEQNQRLMQVYFAPKHAWQQNWGFIKNRISPLSFYNNPFVRLSMLANVTNISAYLQLHILRK